MDIKDIPVSVIVAIYKSEDFIEKGINSIRNQTHKNLEILLIDDGSPDRSGQICDSHASEDSRIRVVHKQNGGACEARNVGLSLATGEYITIIDGDDWLAPDYIEYLLNIAVNTQSDMSMTDVIFTTRDQRQVDKDVFRVATPTEAICDLIYPVIPIGPWNKLYKTSLLKDNNITFCLPWSGEGLNFSVIAAQAANQVCIGHRKVYNYRLNNTSSGLTDYKVEMGERALSNIIETRRMLSIRSGKIDRAINWHIWKNHYYLAFLIIASNELTEHNDKYHECRKYMIKHLWNVLRESEVSKRMKVKMVLQAFLTKYVAMYQVDQEQKKLAKDNLA